MPSLPVVDYLSLADPPRLRGNRCLTCSAVFLQRHNGCASCSGRTFEQIDLPPTGMLRTFTIVHRGKRGDPFVSAVVELDDGTIVKSNLVDVPPTPESIPLGGRVELVTYPVATDTHGTEAIAFGFRPV
ncbi:MAG: uncharacterized protein QOG53_1312 [Frankiales bacterium]|nr:uncharacterized protein [Frankiales bacterium]